ncbi:hypothetical protein NESM_000770600 [Novymonas esmeraldas]|uniref:Uncharacterized protein n=1 Tax=Novymonas esmeraldas TaxID=1808958 RepID=A0AAW0EXC0_9TRYP
MIPRHGGLVPAIRGPTTPGTGTGAPATRPAAAPTTVTRYVVCPAPLPSSESAHVGEAAPPERRLFVFAPSADCPAAPRELRVASHFFDDDATRPPYGSDGSDGDEGSDDDAGEGGSATAARGGPGADTAHGGGRGGTNRRRRRARRREPMRLEYDARLDTAAEPVAGPVHLASTPLSEYSHLTCVLLPLPVSWRGQQPPQQATSAGEATVEEERGTVAAAPPLSPSPWPRVTPIPLRRPMLQLWGTRSTPSAGLNGVGHPAGDGASISAAWGSGASTRLSKKDWKTMDAAEADLHRPTRWSDDDDGDGGGEEKPPRGTDDPVAARERKRAKAEATSGAVRAFLVGAKEALRQQGVASAEGADGAPPPPPTPPPPPPPEKARAATPSPAAPQRAAMVLQLGAAGAAVTPRAAPVAATVTLARQSAAAAAEPAGASSTSLDSLASAVVAEMQSSEARASAALMELQKRILKRLPEYATMSLKMKSPASKPEAVSWFQTAQHALRGWMVEHGHTIASDGTVTFGTL